MEKMTKKEMYVALVDFAETGKFDIDMSVLKEFAMKEIEMLDKKALKAKERAATRKAEGDALLEATKAALTDEFQSAPDIVVKVEGEDVTVAKVQYRLNTLVKEGIAVKEQITISGGEGQKARKVMGYKLV